MRWISLSTLLVMVLAVSSRAQIQVPVGGGKDFEKKETGSPTVSDEVKAHSDLGDVWSFSASSRVWSEYVGSNGGVFHDKPVLQTNLTAAHKSGFYFDIWTSVGLESARLNDNFGEEVDLTAGWAGTKFGLQWDIGAAYIFAYDLGQTDDDILWSYAEVKKELSLSDNHTISPFLHLDYYAGTKFQFVKPWIEGGLYHIWKLNETVSFDSRFGLLYDTAIFGFDSGFVGKYKGSLNWKLSERVTLELPTIKFSHPFMDDQRENEIVAGAGLQIKF